MESKENNDKNSGNKTKQQITIPFIWEEKPGAPKENWKTKTTTKRETLTPVPQPVKYVASVPFKWEEKPGTPLSCFVQESKVAEKKLENMSLPLPPAYFAKFGNESDGESSSGDDHDYQDWLSELEFETLSVLSEESFCSTPSLTQASHPVHSRMPVSSAEPLHSPVLEQKKDGYLAGSASSEISSASSCASRNTNLRGSSPKSSFFDKPSSSEETDNGHVQYGNGRRLPTLDEYEKLKAEFRQNSVIRRPMTLGELIMQSRRRSYRRKAVQKKRMNAPKDLNEKPQGCFNLGGSGGGLTRRLGKDLLSLKLS
ncbi:hypothetical protein RND81_14G123800 [Saponaria officinalis]|uniref:Uncharacterized protein n=1 Tax=Saponaria officinalis TaxID=3572 RepID=A0AAW1GPJ3_SAPOF